MQGEDRLLEPLPCRASIAQVAAWKESNMRSYLKGAAIALALAGTALATSAAVNAAGMTISTSERGRDHGNSGLSISIGDVAFAFQDGYWDNSHRWHKWRNSREQQDYRNQHGDRYRNGNHGHYSGQGWQGH